MITEVNGTLTVVDPNSEEISTRLRQEHPMLSVSAVAAGFADWYGARQ
jgi:hypothetical protein